MTTENLTEMRTLTLCVQLNALKRELYMTKDRDMESKIPDLEARIARYETERKKRGI